MGSGSDLCDRLEPYSAGLEARYAAYAKTLAAIEQHEGGLAKFSEGYKTMGLQVDSEGGVRYKEWAPNATEARLIGDFSKWFLEIHVQGKGYLTSSRRMVPHRQPNEEERLRSMGVLCPTQVSRCLCHPPRLDDQNLNDPANRWLY